MSGQNMESLLMGGDDSSSGESDDEVNVPMGTATTAASTVAAPAPVPPPPRVVQAPKPPVQQQQPQQSRGKSGTNQMARLKNLYTMSKSTAGTSNPAPQPLHRPPMQQAQRPPQQQMPPQQQVHQEQRQSHPQMQQRPMQQQPSHPSMQQQQQAQQHKRTQLYQQSSQQAQQQQMQSRPQSQQRQPQYTQPSSQQRQPQYSQQPQQQPMQARPQTQPRQSQYPQSSSQQRQQQYAQQVQRQRQSQSRSSSSSQQQSQQVDPFAPTPLSQIKQTPHLTSKSQHSRRTHPQQQMPSQRTSTQPMSSRAQQMPGATSQSASASHQEMKRNKEKFLMFTRVLIKYLEQKDPNMHAQAKAIIKDCAERNKRQEPGYESVTLSMKRRLRDLVGDHYWKKANDYLVHFIEQKKRQAGITSSRGGSSSSAAHQARAAMRVKQQQQMEQRRRQELAQRAAQAKLKKEQVSKQRTAAPSIADVRKGIQDKREQLESSTTTTKAATKSKKTTAASKASESKTTTKKTTKKTVRRKSTGDASTSSRKGTTSKASPPTTTTTIVKRIVVEEHPREYQEMMELIDHAVQYDWPSIGQLLGSKADLKLSEDELQLLYGDNPPESLVKKKSTTKTAAKSATSTPEASKIGAAISSQDASPSQDEQNQGDVKPVLDGIKPGWGQTNVLSARAAWARIRLRELKLRKREAASSAPVVADGLLTLPTAQQPQASVPAVASPPAAATAGSPTPASTTAPASTTSSTPGPETEASMSPPVPAPIEGSWVNEETAEQDKALALLSEGCQIYLKGVLQKAVQCARQRQNLDGIRLWHQQHAFSKGVSSITSGPLSKDGKNKNLDKSKKPPLALRLGCDVSRQVAQAQGNAALTVKRMEEALDRQSGIPMRVRELNTETMLEATSMGDLSWRPLLKKGVEKADTEAKRSFEVYGGKEAKDPPLGRVPKKAKLLLEDFVMGSELSVEGPYHKAYTASTFISF